MISHEDTESGPSQASQSETDKQMFAIRQTLILEAADWIARVHAPDCSAADLSALTGWLETSETHADAYATAIVLWSERDDALRATHPARGSVIPFAARLGKPVVAWGAGLTGLAAAAVAAFVWLAPFGGPATQYETRAGGRQEVTLSDGTDLSLNTNTRVSVRIDDRQRVLKLDHGEIAIDVGEKSDAPLTVLAGDILISDVGAQLSVSRLNGVVRVTMHGDDANDLLDGGSENDTMYGGEGNDTYVVDHAGDRVFEKQGEGNDTVKAAIDYALTADVESLYLTDGAISGTGNALVNTLNGSNLDNVLSGLGGNDNLHGLGGDDTLIGGGGADNFIFAAAPVNGHDTIVDFVHGVDRLVFASADYGFAAGHELTDAEFTHGTAAIGSSAQFVWDAASGRLYFDADGDAGGQAIELATIGNGAVVSREDLVIS